MPAAFIERHTATQATEEEMRRYYVAMINYWIVVMRLYEVLEENREADEEESIESGEEAPANYFERELIKLLDEAGITKESMSPLLGIEVDDAESSNREEGEDEDEDNWRIKTVPQLCQFTSQLERAAPRVRKYLATTPPRPAVESTENGEPAIQAGRDPIKKVWLHEYEDHFHGYPPGTRLIGVEVFKLHAVMTSVHGHLKVIAIIYLPD